MLGLPSVSSIAFSNAKVQKIICALRKINVKTHKKDTFGQFAPLEHIYNKVYVEVHVRYMIGTCSRGYRYMLACFMDIVLVNVSVSALTSCGYAYQKEKSSGILLKK